MNKTFSTFLVALLFTCLICPDTGVGTRQQAIPVLLSPTDIFQTVRLAQNTSLAVAAKKAVEQRFIPKKPAAKSRKFKKQSFWKRLKFWKKKKIKNKPGKKGPGIGKWVLSFIAVIVLGLVLLYLVTFTVFALAFEGLTTLAILTLVLGIFGIVVLLRKIWNKIMGVADANSEGATVHTEDIQGKANQPTEPEGADIPRYQYLELDNSEITLCIYNTQSGNTPVRVRMGAEELTSHFGVANDPKCFDLTISENAKNEIHFEAPDQAMEKKELLRIVVEDGDIAREIYVRKGGILELFLK